MKGFLQNIFGRSKETLFSRAVSDHIACQCSPFGKGESSLWQCILSTSDPIVIGEPKRDGRGNILFMFSKPAGHDLVRSLAGVQEAADLKARGRERFDCSILNN